LAITYTTCPSLQDYSVQTSDRELREIQPLPSGVTKESQGGGERESMVNMRSRISGYLKSLHISPFITSPCKNGSALNSENAFHQNIVR